MKPVIQAAVDSGRPPLELLLDQPGRKRGKWDGKLIKALYLNEQFEINGHPIWVEDSPDIVFEAKRRKLRSAAVVEAAEETHSKKTNPEKGVRFYAEAKLKPGAVWPTRQAWSDRRAGKVVDSDEVNHVQRVSDAEQRAKEKVASNPAVARMVAEAEAKLKGRANSPGKME